jgi:2-pyrone-4,6-dicarboxylate lactonase
MSAPASTPKASYHNNPTEPKLKLPAGSCDAHFHVFGPKAKFPFAKDAAYLPADAPKEVLIDRHMFLGIDRGIVVQSAAHGFDNSAAADLLADKKGSYFGVALVPVNVDVSELKKLHEQGFRGVRFNYMKHLGEGTPVGEVLRFAAKLADLRWHLQIHMDSSMIGEMASSLRRSPVPVVIDHMGRVDASLGLDQPAFAHLVSLLKNGNMWVKVSGCERASRQASPWKDAIPFARKLVEEFPERTMWGTDWPHPNLKEVPNDGVMVDNLAEIAPSEAQRHALLVENPARFYGFKA